MRYPPSLSLLVEELMRLPGIGEKNAQRLAFYMLGAPRERVESLARALTEMKERIGNCSICGNLAEEDICNICEDRSRVADTLCVVAFPRDVIAIEGTGRFRGRYHVLMGVLSPIRGIGPDDIRVRELMRRLEQGDVREVIMATNLDVEGDATASYLNNLIRPLEIKVTRLARGIPTGGSLEHTDHITLGTAIGSRQELQKP